MAADPRTSEGEFARLFADIRSCKQRKTCPELTTRALYFEPNPSTAAEWAERSLFLRPIDRRVMFVCESPSNWTDRGESLEPVACWADDGHRSRRFQSVRERFGFADCFLTNSVKCGPRRGGCHTEEELQACAPFLIREIELISPEVLVGVGGNATWALQRILSVRESRIPALHSITHYSARWSDERLEKKWKSEFTALQVLLGRVTGSA